VKRHTFPARWKARKLDQLGFVGRGRSRHRPRNEPSLYGGEYPFFQTGDIKAANLYLTAYSQTYNEKGLAQSKQWDPGTLCITIAANIADTAILGIRGCFPDSVIGFITDSAEADVRFIKYYIDFIKLDMQQVSHGTTQDNLSLDKLLRFDFVVPDVEEQRKIAAILSAYDDLIENNLRRIKILEEMAQNLYREWFVKFRFPGHQHARFTDSPLGRISEGWEVVSLGKLAELRKDKFKEKLHSECPLLDLAKMQQRTLFVGETGSPDELTTSRIIFEEDDILFGSIRPYLHKVALAPCRGVTNVSVLVIRPAEKSLQSFLAVLLSSIDTIRWADQHSTGTKMPVIKWEAFQTMPVLMPSQSAIRAFETSVQPMLQTVKMASSRNQNLRRTRDLLLPKLISGEVDVSTLDIAVPEEACA
jgi:type I restriction enzyme S subunit